jgi:hypothetical protein
MLGWTKLQGLTQRLQTVPGETAVLAPVDIIIRDMVTALLNHDSALSLLYRFEQHLMSTESEYSYARFKEA